MAKTTFSVSNLTFEQAVAVNTFLGGAAVPAATGGPAPAPPSQPAPPVPLAAPATVMPPTAAMPAAPPPFAAAPPPTPAPAPAATAGDPEIGSALTAFVKANGAQKGVDIVKQATSARPDGDPKKGSAKYQDIPAEYKPWVLQQLGVAA